MRTDRVLIISLLLLAPAGITGQTLERGAISPPASDQSNHRAGLVVTSNVPGALIYLDSLSVGVTPLDRTDLRPGVYHLRVIHPERRSWYSDSIDDTVELKRDGRLEFRAFFDYVYRIQSIPFGAKILLGNLYQGETPAVLKTPNRLVGTLLLRKEGYDDASYDLGRWNRTRVLELAAHVQASAPPRERVHDVVHAAADVGPVPARNGEAQDVALVKDRRDVHQVGRVDVGDERIVVGEDVARGDSRIGLVIVLDHPLDEAAERMHVDHDAGRQSDAVAFRRVKRDHRLANFAHARRGGDDIEDTGRAHGYAHLGLTVLQPL